MRVAILVVVVAVHVALIWLFPSFRRLVLPLGEDEEAVTPIFLPPPPNEATVERRALRAKDRATPERQGTRLPQAHSERQATPEPGFQQPSSSAPTSSAPDWRAQVEVIAQANAQHIVEAEDDAARKAAALTSRFKPLPGPRVRGPEFGWDYAPTHRITHLDGGGFVIALNDRCAVLVFIVPMIGCSVGYKPPANGDLFKFMHPPVKFGDWDWRVQDP